ncbi:ABC transporter ATP-binding protein [Roseobacter sp. HKCCA0434]|uniref:ABC transporter ATP-binding protein n=1 Tax=Roseobacter sp. HKCCA0434 TaxID=3079297 RepID=UPI002905D117|nr:ABC transporter ATP-binding protein [Roseobacter sp. HKCCA0434]
MTFPGYRRALRILARHIPRHRSQQLVGLAVLTVASTLAELLSISAAFPFLAVIAEPERLYDLPAAEPLIAFLGAEGPQDLIAPLCLLFAAAVIMAGALRLTLIWTQSRLSHLIGIDLAVEIFYRTLYQPYSVHAARNSSRTISVIMGKSMRLVTGFMLPLFQILAAATLMVLAMGTLLLFVPGVALSLVGGIAAVYGLTALVLLRPIAHNGTTIAREMPRTMQALQEGLGGIRDVLLDGSQPLHVARFARSVRLQRLATADNVVMGMAPRYVVETIGIVLIVIVAYVLVTGEGRLQTALPVLGAVALAAQRLLPVAQQAYNAWTQIRGAQAVIGECLSYLEQPTRAGDTGLPPPPLPFERDIRLEGVSLSYASSERPALDAVDLVIERGTRIGIVGPTGSGKSTLADVLMGLIVPDAGQMRVDATPIDDVTRRAWQRRIAHVPQAIFLTDASLAENIAFSEEPDRIDRARLARAVAQAQLGTTVAELPQGLETVVGERGVRLSGGQRQRIAIARALYREADVIVFDEATSALDTRTETRVMEAIAGLDRNLTLIMIAHRLTTLRDCDRILRIEAGRIVATGTPEEMLDIDPH